MADPFDYLVPRQSGYASKSVPVGRNASLVAVGMAPESGQDDLGTVVVRVELGLRAKDEQIQWFDAGLALDLDDDTRTSVVPVAGYVAVRLAVRTEADDAGDRVNVWIGEPT